MPSPYEEQAGTVLAGADFHRPQRLSLSYPIIYAFIGRVEELVTAVLNGLYTGNLESAAVVIHKDKLLEYAASF